MIKSSCKPLITCLLATSLYAGPIFTNIAWSYDGDIDYLAPYVTLDPKSGTLVTIDPRKDQAAAAELQKQHDASAPNAAGDAATPPSSGATPATAGAGGADSSMTAAQAPADTATDQKSGPGTAVIAAVGGLLLIGVVVALTRRKNNPTPDKSSV